MFKPLYNPTQLTCTITIGDWEPCAGVQKLIGFAKGLSFHRVPYFPYWHHSNNIRLGYNRDSWESPVRLFMYAYVNGKLIDPKECVLGLFPVGLELTVDLCFDKHICAAAMWLFSMNSVKTGFKTLPLGYLLNSYAELDGAKNEQIAFKVDIKDLKVNGKMIKIK